MADPLFVIALAAYVGNRWLIRPHVPKGFWHSHFNDCICIPLLVPVMLWGMRRVGLRRHDQAPQAAEILVPLLVWSTVFEVVLPDVEYFRSVACADPDDIVCYALGGLVAALFWRARYGGEASAGDEATSRRSAKKTAADA